MLVMMMMMMTTCGLPTLEESKHECRQSRPAQISSLWWCFLCYDDVDIFSSLQWHFLWRAVVMVTNISTSLILLLNLFCQIGLKNTTLVMIKLYLAMIDGLWLMTIDHCWNEVGWSFPRLLDGLIDNNEVVNNIMLLCLHCILFDSVCWIYGILFYNVCFYTNICCLITTK